MRTQSLCGRWAVELRDGSTGAMTIPGTLDENGIGFPDTGNAPVHPDESLGSAEEKPQDAPISTRFTRKFTYEGAARLSRTASLRTTGGKRYFFEVERARCLRLFVDGTELPPYGEPTLSTPHIFEAKNLSCGEHELVFLSDNSYPGLPHDDIVYSSAATDETQTNWNGLLGYVRLREEEPVFLSRLCVYPRGKTLTVKAEIDAAAPYEGMLTLSSKALGSNAERHIRMGAGRTEFVFEHLPLASDAPLWDEEEGNLCTLTASLSGFGEKTVSFGVRTFENVGGRLALNGRAIFLRSEANCAVFPKTGYPPMTEEEWLGILRVYRSYGVNCVRFHSHCPPEAAFAAADRMGMLMQPELSHWNPRDAFLSAESFSYYRAELRGLLLTLANHPSFVMLTFGNELHTNEEGHRRMDELLDLAHALDPTRLYARSSNEHYGAIGCGKKGDFYTSQKYFEHDLRAAFAGFAEMPGGIQGYLNHRYPNAKNDYSSAMRAMRRDYGKPVFSFEVGQYEVLPDFRELTKFHGVTDPANYRLIRDRVRERGFDADWERRVEATGELSRLCYREEIEAAMRTKEMSGISLLGLQDFPGQGTALVGMLDSHLEPKPYPFAQPQNFRAFFRPQLPLVKLERYTYEIGETLTAEVEIANYGKEPVSGALSYELSGGGHTVSGTVGKAFCPCGANTNAGILSIPLESWKKSAALRLTVRVGAIETSYPVWIYPRVSPVCPQSVHETKRLDKEALRVLQNGGCVYLSPDSTKESLPHSIQAQFSTDFWSVGTFTAQEGGMGQLIDESHPIFTDFPTSFHTDWQWWPMSIQRAVILPRRMRCIVEELDSYAFLRPMAQLIECRCAGGKLLLSSLGLHNMQQYPEARALQSSIYRYLASPAFEPRQELTVEEVRELVV